MNKRKFKKKYFICKDINGNNIYLGDKVEFVPHNDKYAKVYTGIVYWNTIDGAWIIDDTKLKDFTVRDCLGFEFEYLKDIGTHEDGYTLFEKAIMKSYIKKL